MEKLQKTTNKEQRIVKVQVYIDENLLQEKLSRIQNVIKEELNSISDVIKIRY